MAKAGRSAPREGPSAAAARRVRESFPPAVRGTNDAALTPGVPQRKGDDMGAAQTNAIVDRIRNSAEKADPGPGAGNLDPTGNIDQDTLLEVQRTNGQAGRVGGPTISTGLTTRNT